jgi:Mn-dependent DtxR family transcriptional regulator
MLRAVAEENTTAVVGTDAERSCADVTTGRARYLMALLDLGPVGGEPFTQADLARRLGVSGPTAYEMVRRLRSLGLLEGGAVQLTPAGRSAAIVLRSRRNAARALLRDVLGMDEERADEEAAWLAASASPLLGRHLVTWRAHTAEGGGSGG